jgi:YVTN family beta-propeller protein
VSSGDELPVGTVSFLFTDIEGSTRLLKQLRDRYSEVLGEHQRILREAFAEFGGHEIDTQGDSFFVAFRRAKDAVAAALACQRRLAEGEWPEGAELRVRMGIHTGEPAAAGERYVGLGVHRAARICAAGHGGQVLVSQATRELLREDSLPEVSLRDLGEHLLKDLDEPERLYQLVAPGLREEFPPLKTAAPAPFAGREGELAAAAAEEMAKRWRRPGRLVLVLATFGAAVVGAIVGILSTTGGGSSALGSVGSDSVGVIDASSGRIASAVQVGQGPSGVAAGGGAVWVTNADGSSVSRIDPASGEVRQTIEVGGGPAGLVASPGAVWVANGLDGTVSRIDPQTNQVVQTVGVGNGPSGIAYGEGAVWVANSADGTVSRIDSDSGRVTGTIPVVVGATGVVVAFGSVWVVSPSAGSVVVLDPRSGQVEDRIGVGGDAVAVTAGAGAIWVANRADGTISKIDPRARAVTATIDVGHGPDAVAVGSDGVWVANGGDGTLSRIDPASDAVVRTVRLANPPAGLAFSQGRRLYVAVRSTGQEHRGGTLRVVDAPPGSIDPAVAYDAESWGILSSTNDGLVSFRRVGGAEGSQLVPDLAVSIPTPTDGGKTYTFTLRTGIRYSTGRLVQPDDIRAELERVLAVSPGSGTRGFYAGILGANRCTPGKACNLAQGIVTDRIARSITFHLTAPDPDFLAKLALPPAYAVPAGTPAHEVGAPLSATGPYTIAAYRKGKLAKLERNPRFHEWSADAQPQGYPDTIEWRFSDAPGAVTVRAVERGEADIAPGLQPLPKQLLDFLALHYPSQLRTTTWSTTVYFFLNTRVPPFNDVRVRRAVNLAFDRQAFVNQLGRGFAPTCQILPPNFPAYRRTCPYLPGGPAGLQQARTLVDESKTRSAPVTVWEPTVFAAWGRYMASVLDSLGYRARLKTLPGIGAYFQKVMDSRVRAQVGHIGWVSDYPSDLSFLHEEFSCSTFVPANPQLSNSPSEFCNRSIDAQMEQAAAVQATDPPAATQVWQKIEREILAQAPVVPAFNPRNIDLLSKRVGNYQFNPMWQALLDQLWVK